MKDPWYVSERAENIAILYLTDDPEVSIVSREDRGPYDLVVGLSRKPQHAKWQIIFEVKGLRKQRGDSVRVSLSPRLGELVEHQAERPVAMLAVDVESSAMYFAWLRAPVLEPTPQLQVRWSGGDLSASRVKPSELKKHLAAARKYFVETAR